MMPNFILMKFKKFCIFIGPYELAFNEFYEDEDNDDEMSVLC